jgi:hypothetical protein
VADDRRHEVVLIFRSLHQLLKVAEKVLSLLPLPTVKPLIMGYPEHSIREQSLKGAVARINHDFNILHKSTAASHLILLAFRYNQIFL